MHMARAPQLRPGEAGTQAVKLAIDDTHLDFGGTRGNCFQPAKGRELPVPALPMGFGRAGLRAYVQSLSTGGAAPFAGVYNAVGNPALVVSTQTRVKAV